MKAVRFMAIVLLALMCFFGAACSAAEGDTPSATDTQSTDKTEEKTKYVYKIKYTDLEFVSKEEKEKWREPLFALLNNQRITVYDESREPVGYSYIYPDRPCIEYGHDLALFDVNVDGTPELLVNIGGGSAGNACYYVYDIMTGKLLGMMDGGHDGSWCIYFNTQSGKYESVGHFECRVGWSGKIRAVKKAEIAPRMDKSENIVYQQSLMSAHYSIDYAEVDIPDEESEIGFDKAWAEICPGAEFYVGGDSVSIETYFDEQDRFTENYVRITDTAIVLVDYTDAEFKAEAVYENAQKLTDALLKTDQEFIVSQKQ